MGLFRQANSRPASYVLSGYRDVTEYESREPGRHGDQEYADLESAIAAAQHWQQANGSGSTVEVIALRDNVGTVLRVVDHNGVEIIG